MAKITKTIPTLVSYLIHLYRYCLSPFIGHHCRFYPSCSVYGLEALSKHGHYGIWLTVKRLLHCHPFSSGGYHPVPKTSSEKSCLPR